MYIYMQAVMMCLLGGPIVTNTVTWWNERGCVNRMSRYVYTGMYVSGSVSVSMCECQYVCECVSGSVCASV